MRLWGFDPGGTTGWACFDLNAPEAVRWDTCGEIGPEEHHWKLWEFLQERVNVNEDRIVCESFQYRAHLDKAELISCEYIGVVKLYCADYGLTPHFQTASQGKIKEDRPGKQGSFTQKRHLEKLGLWIPGQKHAMDGYGHLLYYIIHCGDPAFADLRLKLLTIGWK